jgi:WhiB family redox-sensing transcriptional regulator
MAKAICASCPIRVACYERAVANRERYGIWGGVNFERKPSKKRAS